MAKGMLAHKEEGQDRKGDKQKGQEVGVFNRLMQQVNQEKEVKSADSSEDELCRELKIQFSEFLNQ